MHRQASQEAVAISGGSKLWEQSEARSSDGHGHRTVPMVPQRKLHLRQDRSIDILSTDM